MIPHPAQLWPGGTLARQHRLPNKVRGRVLQYAGKVGVGDLGHNRDVARVLLAEDRASLGQGVRKDAELGQDMHAVQGLGLGQFHGRVHPTGTVADLVLDVGRDHVIVPSQKGYHVRIDLGHDEVVDVEHLGQSGDR